MANTVKMCTCTHPQHLVSEQAGEPSVVGTGCHTKDIGILGLGTQLVWVGTGEAV
jgi:hypothetical protein